MEPFWDTDHPAHPPLTRDKIEHAERTLRVTLPAEYLSLLQRQNGGYTKRFAYPTKERTTWAPNHIPLDELFGIEPDPDMKTGQNIMHSTYMIEEWGLPPAQVLLTGDGHWWITLDYRNGKEPCISWIDVECKEDIQIAPTFKAFILGLRPAEEFEE